MWIRGFLVVGALLAGVVPAWACSCVSYEPVKACAAFYQTPVIFRGRVMDTNAAPGAGPANPASLYRFEVLEAFKGIAPGVRSVFVDPASMTSCGTRFTADKAYLVFTGDHPLLPVGTTALHHAQQWNKVFPERWKRLANEPVYQVSICSLMKVVTAADPDVAYLRLAAQGKVGKPGWVEGRAVQNFGGNPYVFAEFMSAPDAVIEVTSSAGQRIMTRVNVDGTYRTPPLAAGSYRITARSARLGAGEFRDDVVKVPSGGCTVGNVSFASRASIAGTVVDANGKAAAGIQLNLGEVSAGKVRALPASWAETDRMGRFTLENVPVGKVVLAANLEGAPTREMPFYTVFAPGTQDVAQARVFALNPGQQLMGVTLRLPRALIGQKPGR